MPSFLASLLLGSCRVEFGAPERASDDGPSEVWLYTSMYEEVLAEMRPMWEAAFPDLRVEVFQGGSEKVAQRYEAERTAGGSRACLIATSDPAWYADLAERGELAPFVPPAALTLDPRWVDAQGRWTAVRVSLMVLATSGTTGPGAFRALADPAWRGTFSTPDPLSSGTAFTTWSTLEAAYGAEWVDAVFANGLVAAGGNSSVLARMESGERPHGAILYENLLLKPGGAARTVLPSDGAVAVPGPLAIPRGCPDPHAAERLYLWFFGDEAQAAIARGGMHSPLPGGPAPEGAPSLAEIALFPAAAPLPGFKERWAERAARGAGP